MRRGRIEPSFPSLQGIIVPGSWVLEPSDLSSAPSFAPRYAFIYLYRSQLSHLKMETIISPLIQGYFEDETSVSVKHLASLTHNKSPLNSISIIILFSVIGRGKGQQFAEDLHSVPLLHNGYHFY